MEKYQRITHVYCSTSSMWRWACETGSESVCMKCVWDTYSTALRVFISVRQQEGNALEFPWTFAHCLRLVIAARQHRKIMSGKRNRRTCNKPEHKHCERCEESECERSHYRNMSHVTRTLGSDPESRSVRRSCSRTPGRLPR